MFAVCLVLHENVITKLESIVKYIKKKPRVSYLCE